MRSQRVNEVLLVFACLAVDCALIASADGDRSWPAFLGIASVLGQVLAMGLMAATRRGSLSPVIALLVASMVGGGLICLATDREAWARYSTMVLLASFAVYLTARCINSFFPWLLPREGVATSAKLRFSIARIMIWTGIVAATLALVRTVEWRPFDYYIVSWLVGLSVVGVVTGGIAILARNIHVGWRCGLAALIVLFGYFVAQSNLDGIVNTIAILEAWLLMLVFRFIRVRPEELEVES